jgi:predicted RNA-binding Zn ribbon-like protein
MTGTASEPLIGGHPALDFTNSVGWHAGADQIERFHAYADLLDWAGNAKVLRREQVAVLGRRAAESPRAARTALERAIEIRELIYRIFTEVAKGATPKRADLDRLRTTQLEALRHAEADWSGGLAFSFARSDDLLAPVWPLVLAAVDLLRSPELQRVRQCANDPCGWLFIDRSRNRSRRWCSSGDCGNEARVRRFRAKHGG